MAQFSEPQSWPDSVTAFLDWWGGELRACLPTWLRRIGRGREHLVILVGRDRTTLRRGRNAPVDIIAGSAARGEEAEIVIGHDAALRTRIKLSAAVLENLEEAISFQLDRYTPFTAQDAYFACRMVTRDPVAEQVTVDLTLAPRLLVDRAWDEASRLGLDVIAVTAESAGGGDAPVALPIPALRRRRHARIGWNAVMAASFCLLLSAVIALPLRHEQAIADALSARLDAANLRAEQVARLDNEIQQLGRQANFLDARKRSQPSALALLRELTHRLPDDTWLASAEFSGTDILLTGESASATALIGDLAASPYFRDPQFRAALTPDQQTGKDHFEISAAVVAPSRP